MAPPKNGTTFTMSKLIVELREKEKSNGNGRKRVHPPDGNLCAQLFILLMTLPKLNLTLPLPTNGNISPLPFKRWIQMHAKSAKWIKD